MNTFGQRLRELREERKLLSKELARIMNVEPGTITNWEKGNRFPKDEYLVKIADYFNVTIDSLLGRPIDSIENTSENATKVFDKSEFIVLEDELNELINIIDNAKVTDFYGVIADMNDLEFIKLAYQKFIYDIKVYNQKKYIFPVDREKV